MELKVEPREVLNSLLDRPDVLAVLPTGSEKSSYFKIENTPKINIRLKLRGYSNHLIEKTISDVSFTEKQSACNDII